MLHWLRTWVRLGCAWYYATCALMLETPRDSPHCISAQSCAAPYQQTAMQPGQQRCNASIVADYLTEAPGAYLAHGSNTGARSFLFPGPILCCPVGSSPTPCSR
ncbi:hypothetical protein HaLaN_11620 [Haematococcus lacustris]|uniref:Secreted protein n=1 Tax=Haematococcus lacustris TaxID=44745 RepID=A0A699YYM1_HAELA|nr:hypothetical protein HaLaN_11620 [Haematococcus lacustris]